MNEYFSSFPTLIVACLFLLCGLPLGGQTADRLGGKNVSNRQTNYQGRSAVHIVATPGAVNATSYAVIIIINDLKLEPRQGGIALWIGPAAEGYFANLKITAK